MTLIPIILYFGGFILIMFGFALSVRAKNKHIRLIRQGAPTKDAATKKRMTILYRLYADPELDTTAYNHYNLFWVLSLFLWFVLLGAYLASIYVVEVYQDTSFSMMTSILAILGLINYLFFESKREKAFSQLKEVAVTKHPEWEKIWRYYPKTTRTQLIAKILAMVGMLAMLSTEIAIFFLN